MKCTPPSGEVRVTLVEMAQAVENGPAVSITITITITDSGIGLDVAELPRLFERFYRGAHARQHVPEGTELGLAIARTIVERHLEYIGITPASQDAHRSGCRVEVKLPIDR